MRYKLLAIDMDGTFLNDEHNVTQGNAAAIKRAADKGIKIVICSGRIPTSLKTLMKYIPEHQPMIAGNGSIILDEDHNEIYSKPISRHRVLEIINMLKQDYGNIFYSFVDSKYLFFEGLKSVGDNVQRNINDRLPLEERIQARIIENSINYINENKIRVVKFEIYDNNPQVFLKEIRNKLEKFNDIEITSMGIGMEITSIGVNKGNSLKILADYYGLKLEECIAVGNDENDLEMIKVAGLGIAVKNAIERIKGAANYITESDNNNDAIEEVIEKFIETGTTA